MSDRNKIVKEHFQKRVLSGDLPELTRTLSPEDVGLTHEEVIDIFETQVMSRHLDLHSRVLQRDGHSFYTIGSSGHEGNAAVASAFRPTDMAFLHYRDGAFLLQRAKQVPGESPLYDMLLSFSASSEDPISGGRHKVLGSKKLNIPPQTSTIASHLPKAIGAAYSVPLAKRVGIQAEMPEDAVVICSFGDASANHSTAQGAINAAAWASYQSVPVPLVFICEDNGIGISTATPDGWIKANFSQRAGLHYMYCDGLNILDTYEAAREAAKVARERRQPVFLHMRTVRLLGHAGSDAEFAYRSIPEIEQTEAQDPLLHTAKIILDNQLLTAQQLVDIYEGIAERVIHVSKEAISRPKLTSAKEIMASLVADKPKLDIRKPLNDEQRLSLFTHEKHNLTKPHHLAKLINWTLLDAMAERDNMIVFGEDVAKKGGVYHVTTKLHEKFGSNRVINTLLDEQSILGLAIGAAHNGFLPIPEIQFLAYVHNAEDQIRGEAATLSFFSQAQYDNPMVIRIAGLAYQRGFGGHFHNDNSFAVFRDIPGVIVCCPSNGADAIPLLRSCIELAQVERRVVIFLEPIALYMKKDLHQEGDGLWSFPYVEPKNHQAIRPGEFATYGDGKQVCIITYGNGYYLSRQAEAMLAEQGVQCNIIDLRWLAPLDDAAIYEQAAQCDHVLIVDECRETGSISEQIYKLLHQQAASAGDVAPVIECIAAEDCFIPLGTAAYELLPSSDAIVEKVLAMTSTQNTANKITA